MTTASKTKPELAVDTALSRHKAPTPKQLYPYEGRRGELSFVSLSDVRALKKTPTKKTVLKQSKSNGRNWQQNADAAPSAAYGGENLSGSQRGTTGSTANARDSAPRPRSSAVHKRIKGLRPSPLHVPPSEISPSDRLISIGIAIPPDAVRDHEQTPPATAPDSGSPSRYIAPLSGQDLKTPTIVITPAKEDFDLVASPEEVRNGGVRRLPSSVYSRYTDGVPTLPSYEYAPPVPPLPPYTSQAQPASRQRARESTATLFEEHASARDLAAARNDQTLSICTEFEEDSDRDSSTRHFRRLTSQAHLPTPRRSRGWWNIITSPFSPSHSQIARSPSPLEDEDGTPILGHASEMGTSDPHAGWIFTNRSLGDEGLRSAPPTASRPASLGGERLLPRRSDTAPGALDANSECLNIYRIPSQGAAAAYYNPNVRFSSMSFPAPDQDRGMSELEGWSPSQSVFHEPRDRQVPREAATDSKDEVRGGYMPGEVEFDHQNAHYSDGEENPFADSQAVNPAPSREATASNDADADFEGFSGTHAAAERAFFGSPTKEELVNPSPCPKLVRGDTQGTLVSHFSPLSPSPVVEDAHIATFMGPNSSNAGLREVELAPVRTRTPLGPGLQSATMSSRSVDEEVPEKRTRPVSRLQRQPHWFQQHKTGDCHGLGISHRPPLVPEKSFFDGDSDLDCRSRNLEGKHGRRPWYRRFFWLIAAVGATLLALTVVLLAMYVSQDHSDVPVQEQWLNLTGYPPLPTGVGSVISPRLAQDDDGCVNPASLWTCNPPAELQSPESPSTTSLPSFRIEIRFRNDTGINESALEKTNGSVAKRSSTAYARSVARRDAWEASLFASSPAPPSLDDQLFLGRTTDNVSVPHDGEETPFYISLLNASTVLPSQASTMHKRDGKFTYPYPTASNSSGSNTGSNASTKADAMMPRPALDEDGTAAPEELYPFAYAQPLRLYNRGQGGEHYGFHSYFDRSLYISNTSSSTGNAIFPVPPQQSGTRSGRASAVCTWSQTRFHVQIWTRKAAVAALNSNSPTSMPAINSTANDMTAPGSFPYPVTITIDRHGGDAGKKGVYCYGLDQENHVMESVRAWIDESRAAGGNIINPAEVPTSNSSSLSAREVVYGGIDGGDGGCSCQWRDWS